MGSARKPVALFVAAALLYGVLGGLTAAVFAAEVPVSIIVDSYRNGTLEFHWSGVHGAAAAVVCVHTPNADNSASTVVSDTILPPENNASVAGLKSDYIYDICVAVYGAVDEDNNPVGDPIGRGLLFFMPSMTFISVPASQQYIDLPGGGREIGGTPKLGLKWKEPLIFYDPDNTVFPENDPDPDNNAFIPANSGEALDYMQDSLNKIYKDGREIATLNYRINISTELNLLNSGSSQASLLIDQVPGEDEYIARVSGGTEEAAVTTPDAFGLIGIELWGRADETSAVPEPPAGQEHILPDEDILPGTVYYMNIKPIYKDSGGNNISAVIAGDPEDQNGSMLLGDRPYASTPIRFQITKDSANNIYVKIYKINQGSLDLPRLYYEVQVTDDPSIPGDWTVKKTMDDSYFSGSFAITVITGVNPNNEVYYKIVVKSDSPNDRLESPPMPYTLTADTSRPPLPTGIIITGRTLKTGRVALPSGGDINVKSTDITISWDKPLGWDGIKDDLYFHFLLCTSQFEVEEDVPLYVGDKLWGNYPAQYRLVKYISAASDKIAEEGNRLTYTLDAFDLFTWEGDTEADGGAIEGYGDYPGFLLPNTVYYLQMYTTNEMNRGSLDPSEMSDRSIVTSFTTLDGAEPEVPLPKNFALEENGKDINEEPPLNFIDIRFDKVMNLDWDKYVDEYDIENYYYDIYYDIYMSSRMDPLSFTLAGSTGNPGGDLVFTGADDPLSTSVRVRISRFEEQENVEMFGHKLLPNTTYYLKARTRLVVRNKTNPSDVRIKESIDTAALPVTTVRLDVLPPDDSARRPLAPTDFSVAEDKNGNALISGSSITFTWTCREEDVIYQMIKTARKVGPNDELADIANDPEYQSFLQEYDKLSDNVENGAVYLDPLNPVHTGKFEYDGETGICKYTVDRRVFPNKLYYFSLKAVRVDDGREVIEPPSESAWVSIPVTTSLIEAPLSLEAIPSAELGFTWVDATEGLTAEDFRIYVKGPADADYKLMDRSRATVVKDADGKTYYGRVRNLSASAYYDIRVVKGTGAAVYEKTGVKTRDAYHEIEIKWTGMPLDDYTRYEIAVMAEGGPEYTVLSAADLEQYVSKSGAILPYYPEETAATANSGTICYYARIKSVDVLIPGGISTKQPLRSNTKYFIKVRTVKTDPIVPDVTAYSKFVGPVSIRTEFSQDDYDDTDRKEKEKAEFLDKVDEIEKGFYWRVAIGNGHTNTILLKGERVANAMENSSNGSFIVDLTALSQNAALNVVYVPIAVIRTMNSLNKALVIKVENLELQLSPETLDVSSGGQLKDVMGREEVKDVYIKIEILQETDMPAPLPAGRQKAAEVKGMEMQALGFSKTDREIAGMIHNKLYEKEVGLVDEKLNLLLNAYVGGGSGSAGIIEKYAANLAEMIEKELSEFIGQTLQEYRIGNAACSIEEFGSPVSVGMAVGRTKGALVPYVFYNGSTDWQKAESGTARQEFGNVMFFLARTGKFVVMTAQAAFADVPHGYEAENYIVSIASKFDLGDVFYGAGINLMPENKATCKEVVLLYEKATGKTTENAGLDIRDKSSRLGLDGIIHPGSLLKNIKRQELAAVLFKLFSVKKGIGEAGLKPSGRIIIADEEAIGDDFYQSVLLIVDMKVMGLDEKARFNPESQVTRAEVLTAFAKMLELTGDI